MDIGATLRLMRLARVRGVDSIPSSPTQIISDLESLASLRDVELELLLPLILNGASRIGILDRLEKESRYALEARSLGQETMAKRQQEWLRGLVEHFKTEDLKIILLKGAAFRGVIYPEDAPRGAADIDFLVRKADWHKACCIVGENTSHHSEQPLRRVSLGAGYEAGFLASDDAGAFVVEVHRGLTNPIVFSIDERSLWSRAVPHPGFDGETVMMLPGEDNLLHLAVHGYRHLEVFNHNLLDAHELILGGGPQWDTALMRADEWGAKRALYFLLEAAKQILGTPVPDSVLQELEPSRLSRWGGDAFFRLRETWGLEMGQTSYRLAQLFGQMWIPDSKRRVLTFQGYYAIIRLLDFFDALYHGTSHDR